MNLPRRHLIALGFLLFTASAHAQYELKAGNFNSIYVPQTAAGAAATPSGPPVVANPAPSAGQFSAMGQVSGATGPISNTAVHADRYPSTPDNVIVLVRSTIGGVFASGVPKYLLGEEITPPPVQADGATLASANYWRTQPVLAGEFFQGVNGGSPLFPLVNVNVTSAATNSTQVVVASVPMQLVPGATLLGQPVTKIVGNTITLGANANSTITSSTAVPITPATSFYYSPHAEKVYASQPGRVTITWVTRVADGSGNYQTRSEDFAVSSNTSRPVRTIFWTEGAFDGPKVQITDGRITTVNPAYYSTVPKAVAEEVSLPGYNPQIPNLSTLSFDKFNGIGQLHAYNVEGRVLIEYLGNVRAAGNIYDQIGTDVVDIVRVPPISNPTVNLGKQILPHDKDPRLTASPVLAVAQTGATYYGTTVLPDGSSAYYAERETSPPRTPDDILTNNHPDFQSDDGYPSSEDAYNKVVFYWLEEAAFSIKWPKFQDRYWLRWSPNLKDDYAHYTVDATGSTPATGVAFAGGALPEIVYQDDPAQAEAQLDINTQRLFVTFAPAYSGNASQDGVNRSLLKFTSGSKVWYVNLYTQAENRQTELTVDANGTSTVTLTAGATTEDLIAGMVVMGNGITGSATIVRIIDLTHFVLSQNVSTDTTYTFTVQSDTAAPIVTTATVGTRLSPPAGHENAGYIASGTDYYPAGYLNPFVVGVTAANQGAIIPVNALPTDRVLKVRWFKKIAAPSAGFQDLYVPGKWGTYTVSYPATTTPQIVIAQGVGTDDLSAPEAAGSVYYQNDPAQPGYNPNEEHAFPLGGRAYALREDLNVTSGAGYTSEPFVLVAYTDPTDDRPAIHAYKVLREDATYDFDYPATAGTLLVKPYPLPLLPLPLVGTGANRTSKDLEIIPVPDVPANATVADDPAYQGFIFKDRKGFPWVQRGPHDGGSPTLEMKLYYLSRAGFFVPGTGEPAVGTVLPFLRAAARSGQPLNINSIDSNPDGSPGEIDEPLTIVYRPAWPTNAPELRVGETLTLPKFGLPQVRGQASAQVLYEQSIANAATNTLLTKNSVTLHDPTREKTVALDAAGVGLTTLPDAIKTTIDQDKTYFQGLPPHLQQRVYLDPLRGAIGTLIFKGTFHDEAAGEDYLDLNLLTAAEETLVKDLVPAGATDKSKWDAAIDALNTTVETFKPDPAQFGSYIVDATKTQNVGENDLAGVTDPNTAVDSYAVTATGQGTGFVTMVFGDGNAFTPEEVPVQVQVFRIASQLYVGDLKTVASSNPLDEQVTLRHSADFAGKPEDYEFEWRWATGAASAPATYAETMTKRIGDPAANTDKWLIVSDPGDLLPTAAQYTAAGTAVAMLTRNVHPVTYVLDAQNQPTATVIEATSYTDEEIAAGYPAIVAKSSVGVDFSSGVPGNIVFSATLGSFDGCVLYVNGQAALAFKAPEEFFTNTNASTGLTQTGLDNQFRIAPSYFTNGPNTIEVAIYTTADPNAMSALDFMLEAADETDQVTTGTVWQTPSDPDGKNTNTAIVGGNPLNPFGGPQFVLNDRWFTMRYRPKASANNVLGTPWSRWMPPQFVEGWIKRVLAAINPFEQRVKDLGNNAVNTDVSLLTQAGTRWEGDVALTLGNINDVGLIAIYETVLNRGKNMSINANTNDPDTNNALTLAAGYLNDLYTILGNEAFADAANPTISLDDQSTVTEVNTSRFSFESQVASSLEEELALLRGRDDFTTAVSEAPAYNRLYWNYTRGINAGEVIYAVNYNIKEKAGSSTANGVIDEEDAQRMFPQGHGDAYGHYLTALTGYYRLLTNPNFTWTPRAEAVTVLGQPVTVDYMDERKFAAAAGNVARTAEQVVALSYRQNYRDDPAAGWGSYRDSKGINTSTGVTSAQGLDEWVSRSTQGAFYHWAVANAMLPDQDIVHTGIQKIDRTTVPEIPELPAMATSFQSTIDNANAHLNPLGLSPGAIAFDISPAEMQAGNSHFEQVYGRALRSLNNAAGAFNQAATMTRSLRNQENQIDDYNTVIEEQESAYVNQLIDIFGTPYSGDIGTGTATYAQGYKGPDLDHWFIVDRPNDLVNTSTAVTVSVTEPAQLNDFTGIPLADVIKDTSYKSYVLPKLTTKTVTVQPSQWVQYNDVWKSGGLGSRTETGELQSALQDAQQTLLAVSEAGVRAQKDQVTMEQKLAVLNNLVASHLESLSATRASDSTVAALRTTQQALNLVAGVLKGKSQLAKDVGVAVAEFAPKVSGIAAVDATSAVRGAAITAGFSAGAGLNYASIAATASAATVGFFAGQEEKKLALRLAELGFSLEAVQLAYEVDEAYREAVTHTGEIAQLALAHQRALQNVNNVLAKGNRILAERKVFGYRAAAIIQGYRTKDLAFRTFRNEALEQYRSLFDLSGRYTYLAAKSYDYETGLLGTSAGQTVFSRIVKARSLGDLTGGVPQSTVSTLGDAGLAGTMAQLNADFSVAEGRLGINNPDQYGTVFSLRSELYRLRNDPAVTSDDDAWQQTIEQHIVANVMADADVATYCRNIKKPDGTPVPGIVIPFSTTIQHGQNFFGRQLAAGDHAYTPSNFATKIYNVGIALPGYVGMDSYAAGNTSGVPSSGDANALSATPYAYLIPCGSDYMLAPPLGDTNTLRVWDVKDQALPLPYNLGANDFNSTQFFNANGTLSEQPWILRKHQAFRMVDNATAFYSSVPAEFTNSRLIGRSVWNGQWKIVIPAYTLLNNEQDGLNKFAASVKDIQLFLRTYSNSGN